ncbi:MAG: hypothetical protein LBR20_00420 [Propionibacteriaceae bacterium]|jgi:hypothetical protein|nr:hypothetical protein [Propionibacteriaceae bacterium]
MHKQRLVLAIVGAVGIITTFLPWMTVSGYGLSASGIQTWGGWITFLLSAGAIVVALFLGNGDQPPFDLNNRNKNLDKTSKFAALGAGVVIALVALLVLFQTISWGLTGFGVYLAILVGIAMIAIPFLGGVLGGAVDIPIPQAQQQPPQPGYQAPAPGYAPPAAQPPAQPYEPPAQPYQPPQPPQA